MDLEQGRLSLHFATPYHTLWMQLDCNLFFIQQDIVKHNSKLCRKYLEKKQSAGIGLVCNGVTLDVNPIEQLWQQLDCMV